MKLLVAVIAIVFVCGCSFRPAGDNDLRGWELSESHYDSTAVDSLRARIENDLYKHISSVVVVRNGKLLVEEYFNGATRHQTHDTRSVGKTFASAVLGIAIEEGYIQSVNQTLEAFYPLQDYDNFSGKKQRVTLRDLVTMSSGFEGNDNDPASPGNEENMYPRDNWVSWTLNLPMAADRDPGDSFSYFTAGVVVLGDILNKAVPGGLEDYARQKLFEPLGITGYQWQYTPQGVPNTAGGIQLTPLDLARFGQLYLSTGKWDSVQLIPEQWIEESLTRHFETGFSNSGYGYLFWNKKYQVNGREIDAFFCSGNGGNKVFVLRQLNAVVVVTATAYNQAYAHSQVDDMMTRHILPLLLTVR